VDPVFLHLAGRDLIQGQVPEKWDKMDPQPDGVALCPFLAALTFGDNAIFLQELIRGLFGGRAVLEDAGPKLPL
jgi:hypothetical protein